MRQQIEQLLQTALKQLEKEDSSFVMPAFIQVDATKDKQYGDFASNIAMVLAKQAKINPRALAAKIIQAIPISSYIQKVEVAGPGFINFYLSSQALNAVIEQILMEKEGYGRSQMGRGKRILIEFVSSNPTGPLHVGHGRLAAIGAVVANLLDAVGFKPYKEYYVNDAGRQMDIVTVSIWLRYLALCGEQIVFPYNAYKGNYIIEIAKAVHLLHKEHFYVLASHLFKDLPPDEPQGGDKERYVDALIDKMKHLLGDKYVVLLDFGLQTILSDIREDLAEFGVHFDNWFSERQFVTNEAFEVVIQKLKASGHLYEKDQALWFRSSALGDEKDRVLVRSNGARTYFANDVVYHLSKFDRGFDIAIDIFGSDHHGYVPRMKAAMEASGISPERLTYLLLQFVTLYRHGEQVQMSTRGGEFVTLRALREEVGNDAVRFFYAMRKGEQHMDFDLDLAKSQSNENPVFYVQYAYARISSVMKQLEEKNKQFDEASGLANLDLLNASHEKQLLNTLSGYPDMITSAALHYEPHLLTHYLRELASDFHAYYNSQQFLVEDDTLRNARLALILAVRQVLLNGFDLLGITARESM